MISSLPKLTSRQAEILHLVEKSIQEFGAPPTRSEIAKQLGFASANAAEEHLKALAKKGYLELSPGTSRGIRLASIVRQAAKEIQKASQTFSQLSLPLIGRVAAGAPILALEHVEKQVPVDPNLFAQGADYLLKVRGMSMRDAGILDGDYLAVKKASHARRASMMTTCARLSTAILFSAISSRSSTDSFSTRSRRSRHQRQSLIAASSG